MPPPWRIPAEGQRTWHRLLRWPHPLWKRLAVARSSPRPPVVLLALLVIVVRIAAEMTMPLGLLERPAPAAAPARLHSQQDLRRTTHVAEHNRRKLIDFPNL